MIRCIVILKLLRIDWSYVWICLVCFHSDRYQLLNENSDALLNQEYDKSINISTSYNASQKLLTNVLNFWQPTVHVQKTFINVGSSHLHASFGTFCVQNGQLFAEIDNVFPRKQRFDHFKKFSKTHFSCYILSMLQKAFFLAQFELDFNFQGFSCHKIISRNEITECD